MSDLPLSAAFGDYDRIEPLRSGAVRARGIDLQLQILSPTVIFRRMCATGDFDVSEMSMGAHLYLAGTGDSPFVAIPAFPSRAFRHAMVYANVDAGIERPEDLNGKRIAIREWGMTAVVWIVGILGDEHGFDLTSVDWVAQIEPRVPVPMPSGTQVRLMQPGETLSDLLESGAVDAALIHEAPACFAGGSERVRRVFPDYAAAERSYHARTGIHPVMHCAVVRRDIAAREPWVPGALYDALLEAKTLATARLLETKTLAAAIPFLPAVMEETVATFGEDFWPYGVEANRTGLERLAAYAHAQGLTPRVLDVESLFAPGVGA